MITTAGGSCGESVCSVEEETGGGAREQMAPSADLLNANAVLSALYVYKLVLEEGGGHGFFRGLKRTLRFASSPRRQNKPLDAKSSLLVETRGSRHLRHFEWM